MQKLPSCQPIDYSKSSPARITTLLLLQSPAITQSYVVNLPTVTAPTLGVTAGNSLESGKTATSRQGQDGTAKW
jgi:hypothetical protein